MRVRPDLPGRGLAALEVARPDQHGEAVRHEILGDLKSDSLIGPGDQGDGFVLHDVSPHFAPTCGQRRLVAL